MWILCQYNKLKEYTYHESAYVIETMEEGIHLLGMIATKAGLKPSFTHLTEDAECKHVIMADNLHAELGYKLMNLKYYAN
jgi:hypothetical protein